jgi:acetyltransferase-like isoleucine patch superfamily enzyme
MVLRPLRKVSLPDATARAHDAWLAELDAALAAPGADWYRIARDTLVQLWHPGLTDYDARVADPATPAAARVALLALDPRNITLEPEYYAEVDAAKFARVKPLLWLWYGFDRSPAGAQNVDLGIKFRRLLAPRIFARCGANFKCFQHTEFSFGYNLEVGDNVVVHRHVLLDDRGGITLGDRVSIADYANIYSHTHSIVDQVDVTDARTVLEDDVRITYHATVLAGVRVGKNGMVGAVAVATKDVRSYQVNVGIPAKSVRVKPNAPPEAYVTERVARREDPPAEG